MEAISEQIGKYDEQIEEIAKRYPEMKVLQQVYGVGPLIAVTYVLTLEDAERFAHSRDVGPYLGLTRKQRDSGDSQPELGISKAGDGLLRSLLVQGAHCILRKGAPESDLRAWGYGEDGEGREARQEASDGGGGAEAGGAAASPVGDGGSVRSAVQPEGGGGGGKAKGKGKAKQRLRQ